MRRGGIQVHKLLKPGQVLIEVSQTHVCSTSQPRRKACKTATGTELENSLASEWWRMMRMEPLTKSLRAWPHLVCSHRRHESGIEPGRLGSRCCYGERR